MTKYPLVGGSICAVVLLVLGSLTNVVGYQTVQSSNQKMIDSEIDQKELLFQTIVDMANNKEIQKVILGSEITGKRFFDPGIGFSVFNHPVLTEKFLKRMYTMGVIYSKSISKSKIHSFIGHHPVINQAVQKQISAVIEKDTKLKGELTQLSSTNCDCEENNAQDSTPIICGITELIFSGAVFIYQFTIAIPLLFISLCLFIIGDTSALVAFILGCDWFLPFPPPVHDRIIG